MAPFPGSAVARRRAVAAAWAPVPRSRALRGHAGTVPHLALPRATYPITSAPAVLDGGDPAEAGTGVWTFPGGGNPSDVPAVGNFLYDDNCHRSRRGALDDCEVQVS
ncbi:hypothetical protein PHYPSEUDO_015111 [Phytophthora pseudosyringae]|uniref:Uncharacterized protein n=1 Tax=Phytophthora pseudosyringae TaxID=221518 RepID=A0A8T1W105_9STRA|nr:hypothetical protein PHYPSEUDO_015111 [Phytophthora pseudosyringae]